MTPPRKEGPREPGRLAAGFCVDPGGRDPLSAAARDLRPQLPKRRYQKVEIGWAEGGFAVLLDGKNVKTPARRALVSPTKGLAEALAAEWSNQGERIDPQAMPLTRLANSAIDGVAERMAEVEAEVVKYAGSDLISYRAGEPAALALAQAAAWDPLVAFARERLGASLTLAEGVVFLAQPDAAIAAIAQAARVHVGDDAASPFRLTALHVMATLTGSGVIALGVGLGEIEAAVAWTAAHVDEDFQISAWGSDTEALARRERRLTEMRAAAFVSLSCRKDMT